MNCLVVSTRRFVVVPRALEKRSQVLQRDPSVDLGKSAIDDVLQVGGTERAAAIQCE